MAVITEIKTFQSTSPVWRTTRIGGNNQRGVQFQSTSPVWRTTMSIDGQTIVKQISIHVPRVEDDADTRKQQTYRKHFNPRPPCGGRRFKLYLVREDDEFQSTSPVWRTTCRHPPSAVVGVISIHVPRVEDDLKANTLMSAR